MSSRPRAPEFFSLPPLAAVAVLVLNDHVLKGAFRGTLTGKLSDVAGCFFLPLFVSAVLAEVTSLTLHRRIALGVAATLALFVPIKLFPQAASAVARAVELVSLPLGLGAQHITVDPTDLLALPMVLLAAHYARKVNACDALSN
jgi:hypothetical protein